MAACRCSEDIISMWALQACGCKAWNHRRVDVAAWISQACGCFCLDIGVWI